MLGGFYESVKKGMVKDGVYQQFVDKIDLEWSKKFTEVKGTDVNFALPNVTVTKGRDDFVTCRYQAFGEEFAWGVATASY